jgi:acetylornithine deacetylase/succinyl-diaminopimelate desuccinylase-like protein
MADNLGPLALRLLALEDADDLPGMVWVIQGEEEIGSPWAHTLYPTLELPRVALWLEETGYFEADGTQRLLARHLTEPTVALVERLRVMAAGDGRGLQVHERYLNKAFGQDRCPCLTWLVGETPYLAIGPNDTHSRIHAADESLPLDTLDLSARQFLRVLREATTWR